MIMQDGSWSNEKMNRNYNRILIASCTANASQAIFANMTALLMVPFMSLYGLTLEIGRASCRERVFGLV